MNTGDTVPADIEVSIRKQVRTVIRDARAYADNDFSGSRLVSEVDVVWEHVDGAWQIRQARYVSSLPREDGTPSRLWTTRQVYRHDFTRLMTAFPEAAAPPPEIVTLTIEGAPQ